MKAAAHFDDYEYQRGDVAFECEGDLEFISTFADTFEVEEDDAKRYIEARETIDVLEKLWILKVEQAKFSAKLARIKADNEAGISIRGTWNAN